MTKFELAFSGQQNAFNITRQGSTFHVDCDGRSFECLLRFVEGSYFVLELVDADGKRKTIRAAGFANGENRQLWIDGRMVQYRRVRQGRAEAMIDGSLSSAIPAVVTQILVEPGDFVSTGEKLILLESMKMIIPIQAPYDSFVTAINCREGESIQAGIQLIELTRKEIA
ncbi:MAG: biotin/lipoyl-containing protein [Candidatus Promineifilaceae bacterium]|jgi:acetyl-CoA carboxylase biotin carboxyl carrier protein